MPNSAKSTSLAMIGSNFGAGTDATDTFEPGSPSSLVQVGASFLNFSHSQVTHQRLEAVKLRRRLLGRAIQLAGEVRSDAGAGKGRQSPCTLPDKKGHGKSFNPQTRLDDFAQQHQATRSSTFIQVVCAPRHRPKLCVAPLLGLSRLTELRAASCTTRRGACVSGRPLIF